MGFELELHVTANFKLSKVSESESPLCDSKLGLGLAVSSLRPGPHVHNEKLNPSFANVTRDVEHRPERPFQVPTRRPECPSES